MVRSIISALLVSGAALSAEAFQQKNYPMEADSIKVSSANGRLKVVVDGKTEVDGSIEQVSGAVSSFVVEGLLPDGKTQCSVHNCYGRLKVSSGSLVVAVDVDNDHDGNIEFSVPVTVGRIGHDGTVQVENGANITATFVQYRVRWWERTDGQKNHDYVSLKLSFE